MERFEVITMETFTTVIAVVLRITIIVSIVIASATLRAKVLRQFVQSIVGAIAIGGHIGDATLVARGIRLAPLVAPLPVVEARRGMCGNGRIEGEHGQEGQQYACVALPPTRSFHFSFHSSKVLIKG